jgi:anti-repressor protein
LNQLVFIEKNQAVTDSLTVAEVFEKVTDKVMQDISVILECSEEFRFAQFRAVLLSKFQEQRNANVPLEPKRLHTFGHELHRQGSNEI